MANSKLLPGNVSVYAVYPEAVTNWANIPAAALNAGLTAGTVFDISCAIASDDFTLNTTDSDTDDSRSICDVGNVQTPTFVNYEASMNGFRSDPSQPTAVYDTFFNLFNKPGLPYWLVKRIGVRQGTALATGQTVSAYFVTTDYSEDVVGDNENILLGARFKANGQLNTETTLS